ncbi:hypothetical protein [Symbiopectobacterium sp. RP]|uniref:hypothetical protein n=1 Tax=Symbiopectobacterium sp. RP TaxID=3248553 RepID=UPI003D27A9FC
MITANALICGKKIQLIVIKIMSLGYTYALDDWQSHFPPRHPRRKPGISVRRNVFRLRGNDGEHWAVCQQPQGSTPPYSAILLHHQLSGGTTIRHLQRVAVVEERE